MFLIFNSSYSYSEESDIEYRNDVYNFTIEYPSSWELDEIINHSNPNILSEIKFKSPFEGFENELIQEAFIISINKIPENITLAAYLNSTISELERSHNDFNLLKYENLEIDEFPGKFISYNFLAGSDPSIVLRMIISHYVFIYDNKLFVMTLATHPNNYYDFLPITEKMVESFKILN
ncbi:MAG: hypothetical protein ACPKQO_10635 [Nitrososphaeraceae archaeon]